MWPFSKRKESREEEHVERELFVQGKNRFDDAIKFIEKAFSMASEVNEVSFLLMGRDEFGQHIQCRNRPKRLFGISDAIPLDEWAERAVRKVKWNFIFKIEISIHDHDGDYRSLEFRLDDQEAIKCVKAFKDFAIESRNKQAHGQVCYTSLGEHINA